MSWTDLLTTIGTSAVTSIVFAGGTNYYLQKKNRKGNAIEKYGYELIDKIEVINDERNKAIASLVLGSQFQKNDLLSLQNDFNKHFTDFKNFLVKHRHLFNKKTNELLDSYIDYLKTLNTELDSLIDGKDLLVNINNNEKNKLSETIINEIKKQFK